MNRQAGFTLVEVMVVAVIMSVMAVGVAQFTAQAFLRQTAQGRHSQQLSSARANLRLLDRDITLTGFGQPLGVKAAFAAPSTHPRSDELVLVGGPLVGPRETGWTYVLQAAVGTTFTVRCFGQIVGGARVPHPKADIILDGAAFPVRIINYAGQELTAPRTVVAAENVCSQPGVDVDGDGLSDYGMQVELDQSVSLPQGAILVPMRGYNGVTDATVRYFVAHDRLWRELAGLPAVPLLDNVEAFQVQFGASATDGTQLTWSAAEPWEANSRLRAIRYHVVTAGNHGLEQGGASKVTALDFTYDVPAGREKWERASSQGSVRTPNANFSHP